MQVRRFTHKVVLYSIGLALLSIAGSALISYHFASKDIETTLRMELLAVVKSLAPNIDGELHELIYRDEFGEVSERDLFEEMQVMLQLSLIHI